MIERLEAPDDSGLWMPMHEWGKAGPVAWAHKHTGQMIDVEEAGQLLWGCLTKPRPPKADPTG